MLKSKTWNTVYVVYVEYSVLLPKYNEIVESLEREDNALVCRCNLISRNMWS